MWPCHTTNWLRLLVNLTALLLHALPQNLYTLCAQCSHHSGTTLLTRVHHRALHAPPAEPSLKTQLRALYKRVHPDLFQQHPEAQAENSRSFQLLQEYLHAAQRGGGQRGGVLVPYRFVFFLHPETHHQQVQAPQRINGADHPTLKRVDLVLPPPTSAPIVAGAMPRTALVGLKRILEVALGLWRRMFVEKALYCGVANHFCVGQRWSTGMRAGSRVCAAQRR